MSAEGIKTELQTFESAVKRLSTGIEKASALWGDAKYGELSSAISVVAGQSKDVLVTGEKCCTSIERFAKIAAERY